MFSKSTKHAIVATVSIVTLFVVACTPAPPVHSTGTISTTSTTPTTTTTTATTVIPAYPYLAVMGPPVVSAQEMADWFEHKTASHSPQGAATVSIEVLAQLFLDEGRDEGVRGDIAFAQAMLETGWLRFSTRMPKENNNFSGIGAVDTGTGSAKFPSARIGVRAQIQHLRAYADKYVTKAKLAHDLVDPRFDLVSPKGKAPNWSNFGNGIWATDPGYAAKIKSLYDSLLTFDR
ncbi:MAG: glucosaminidase domain-containing protein [Microthrixaceae bacterium]